jgi:hypothetical protein
MAKLEIKDLNYEVEIKENELGEIKGSALPIPIPRVSIKRVFIATFGQTRLHLRYQLIFLR